jgi:cytochrome P450
MEYDLTDPGLLLRDDVLADPREFYDTLRRQSPVWQIPGQDSYLVSDPLLIRDAVGRPEDFSSNLVSLLHDDGHGCPVAFRMAPYGDPIHVLSNADPPLHTQHRRLLQSHLSPAAVADLGPAITGIVDEQLTALLSSSHSDVVATFSDPVPALTVCELVGLPTADAPFIVRTVSETGALLDGVTRIDGMSQAAHAALELTAYVEGQLRATLERPESERTGLLGLFARAIDAGEVTEGEVRDMLVVLVSAGSETTASLLATAVDTLAGNQELQERLRQDPEGVPAAIEEWLRTDGPFQFHYR